MNLSNGWVSHKRPDSEVQERDLYHHLHFSTDPFMAMQWMLYKPDLPPLHRVSCEGLLDGTAENEQIFEERNGHGMHGLGNPGVKRGI